MEIGSIIYKALFIFTIVLAVFSIIGICINIDAINQLLVISTVPIFVFNVLFIMNSINKSIRDKAGLQSRGFSHFFGFFRGARRETGFFRTEKPKVPSLFPSPK